MPPERLVEVADSKPAASRRAVNASRCGKVEHRARQVGVGRRVFRQQAPHFGEKVLKIKEIETAQRLPGGDGELEHAELAAGAEDPRELGQGAVQVGHVAQPERDRGGVEARVGKRQVEGVGVEDRRLRQRRSGPARCAGRRPTGWRPRNLGAASASIGRQKSAATISIPGRRRARAWSPVPQHRSRTREPGGRTRARASLRRQTRSSEADSRWFRRS